MKFRLILQKWEALATYHDCLNLMVIFMYNLQILVAPEIMFFQRQTQNQN